MTSMIKIGILEIFRSSGSVKIKFLKLLDFFAGSIIIPFLRAKTQNPPVLYPERILIIRPGGIGDAVFVLNFVRALKGIHPSIVIDILCEKRNREVFSSQVDTVNKVFSYDSFASLRAVLKNEYDVVVDTEQWHYLSAMASYFIKSRCNAGFSTRSLRKKLFSHAVTFDVDAHELINFYQLFSFLGVRHRHIQDFSGCFHVSENMMNWAIQKIPKKSAVIFLGSSIPERRFTFRQCLEIIRGILQYECHVILIGGHDVVKEARKVKKEIQSDRIINYVGQTSLEESAALIKRSIVFVGPDSGLMHIACALGISVVAIFGPGNIKKWAPLSGNNVIVSSEIGCSPCTNFGYTLISCNKKYPCITSLPIDKICAAVSERLSADGTHSNK